MKLASVFLLALVPVAATAQPKVSRVCFLAFDSAEQVRPRFAPVFQGLRDLGYEEGRNIVIDVRLAGGDGSRFPVLAAQCVESRSDVIIVATTPAAQAAKRATTTIPIVMNPLGDPIGSGLVKSLARPGGNVTGSTFLAAEMSAKRLALLKEALPRVSRVLVLSYLVDPIAPPQVAEMRKIAAQRGMELLVREIRSAGDYAPAFEAGVKEGAEAVIVTSESISYVNRAQVIELANRHRLPSVLWRLDFAEGGALMSYAPDFDVLMGRTAAFVDRILKGAKPADLPVEQPAKFIFAINLKTARALGVTIPPALMVRADRVIE